MKFIELARLFDRLGGTQGRLGKAFLLSEFLKTVPEKLLYDVVLLIQGRVFPLWSSERLGISSKTCAKSIASASGAASEKVEDEWRRLGDLGEVAFRLITRRKQTTLLAEELTVEKVASNLKRIASREGKGSIAAKIMLLSELLSLSKERESVYIIRLALEDLRVGAAEGTIRDAIAWAFFAGLMGFSYSPESGRIEVKDRKKYNEIVDIVQHSIDISNDLPEVARISKAEGLKGLRRIGLLPGKPIKVMLAQKAPGIDAALKNAGVPCQLEYKYDGFRMQLHREKGGRIRIFTRRLEDVTEQFPDVVEAVGKCVEGEEFILDSECVGYDRKSGKYLPFQKISQRIKRKYDIKKLSEDYPVELNIFDAIFFDGKTLLYSPLEKRRALLEKKVRPEIKRIALSEKRVISRSAEVKEFYEKSMEMGNEGIMVKNLRAPYKPGSRVGFMMKLKPSRENLELAIVGAEWGEGKRVSWLSSFTLACRGEDGEFLEIGKVGTGIKEKSEGGVSFEELTKMLKPLIIGQKGRAARIRPEIVVEVGYEEIQKSTTYSSGYALRFPRLLAVREDRLSEDCSDIAYIRQLYSSQNKVQ